MRGLALRAATLDELLSDDYEAVPGQKSDSDRASQRLAGWCRAATSALDNTTQCIVANSVQNLNATRMVIAHRLSTVIKADRIFVIDAGRVVESGNYDQLMQLNGLFAQLARRQIA